MTQQYKRITLIAGVTILLLAAAFCGYKVHALSQQHEKIKEDYSTVNNITFGLLSVNNWRDRIVTAVTHRINNFNLTEVQEDSLKKSIENVLHGLVDKLDSMMKAPNQSVGEKIKNLALDAVISDDKLHEKVPEFAQDIMDEIKKPSNIDRLEFLAKNKLEELGDETYDSSKHTQQVVTDSLFKKYTVNSNESFEKATQSSLSEIQSRTYLYSYGMLAVVVTILSLWWFLRKQESLHATLYILSVLLALILLLVGLTSAMIVVDARIQSLDFHLIGEDISFENQVLFFQSKSIVDVVVILVETGKFDSILVGILILSFSILFPVSKLLSTGIYLLSNKPWSKNNIIKYFAFKSGKWSMADVMVVAIFMAYIGFNGILDDQLASLNIQNETISSISTNQTSLQPGYIIFVGFVLYGLILSMILKRITGLKEVLTTKDKE